MLLYRFCWSALKTFSHAARLVPQGRASSMGSRATRAFLVCAIACFFLVCPLIADTDLSGELVNT
jgi:hypothetical protein